MNSSKFFQRWVDRVNEAADGELVIEYRGGPEVMSPKDLPDGVIKGVVDIMSEPATLYTSLMPTAPAFSFTELSPKEMASVRQVAEASELELIVAEIIAEMDRGGE